MTKKINFYVERSYFWNKFKARTREKGNLWKAIADNLNSLDGFKVDARAVRERNGVIKAHFEAKEKEEKMTSDINPEVTPPDTALEELSEQERECAKNFEVENKKEKEDQELARSIRQEAVEPFAEIRAKKFDGNEEETGPIARKKSRSFGSESLAYLKKKIEKETKLKEQELELRKTVFLNSTCTTLFFNNSEAVVVRYSLPTGRILGKYL